MGKFFRKLTYRSLTLCVVVTLGLLLLESGLRISGVWIGRHTDTMFKVMIYDETLGWKMKTNLTTKIDLVDVEHLPVRSNSLGFRDHEFQSPKSSQKLRVIFLGDSFTWGFPVLEGQRFTNILAEQHPDWDVLNFGMPGYGTDQSLLVWETIAKKYQPDVVVLTVYKNDYLDNVSVVNDGRQKPYFELKGLGDLELKNSPVPKKNFWDDGVFNQIAPVHERFYSQPVQKRSRVLHWLVKNSNLVRWVYTLSRPHRPLAIQTSFEKDAGQKLDERAKLEIALLDALVQRLVREVQSSNAQFLVVFAGDMSLAYRRQMELLDASGISYLDVTTSVLARSLKEENIYYRYSGHWTLEANRAVAALIMDKISASHLALD